MEGTSDFERTSVASRIRVFFGRCPSFANNASIASAWTKALGIVADSEIPGRDVAELARRLSVILPQLDLLEARLRAEQPTMSANTTSHQINRLRIFVGKCLANLQTPWANVKNELTPDLMKCLEFWDELIEKDEIVIPNSELNDLLVSLRELRGKIGEINTNPELRRVLNRIVDLLIRGITDYHLVGEEAIKAAGREVFSCILENQDLIRDNSDNLQVQALAKNWDRFMRACQTLIFADGLVHAAGTAIQIGGGFLKLIGHGAGS